MNVVTITVAYCPAALLARSLILYERTRAIKPYRHIVIQGHYPINEAKNTNDIALIARCFDGIEIWDPGKDLGSAQSQNWCLKQLDLKDDDFFINLDPDSACMNQGWDAGLLNGLQGVGNCVLMSCMAPMIVRYGADLSNQFKVGGLTYAIPARPTPFNLSMWRYSFIKEIGGIPQLGLWWGETEGAFWGHCQQRAKFHAYALDFMEDESGKFIQDKQHNDYKNFHMRTTPDKQFLGSFEEYLRWKHPALLEIDTVKDLTDHAHP